VYRLDEAALERCTLDETTAALESCAAAGAGELKAVVSAFSTGGGDADDEPLSWRSSSSSRSTRAWVGLCCKPGGQAQGPR